MKKNHMLVTITTLLTFIFLLTGCNSEPEEIIPTFYNEGVYAPEDGTYILELPSNKWNISGDENPEDITFVLNKNEVSVKRYNRAQEENKDEISTIIKSVPSEQKDLETWLKENNVREYTINTFQSNVLYNEKYNFSTTNYIYSNDEDNTYKVYYSFIAEDYLYELRATISDDDTLEKIKYSFNNFSLSIKDEQIKIFKIKEEKLDGNIYNSQNNDFTLTLPYANWNFQAGDTFTEGPYTTISSDGITITIEKQSQYDLSNIIVYEIPNTLEILNKQIELKNVGQYELLNYDVKTVGTLPEYDEKQNFTTFNYLVKCNNNSEMNYYAYTEYRTENVTYQVTGVLTVDYL